MSRSDLDFLSLENSLKPTKPPMRSVLEYVQGRRIMPTSSPAPGPYNINLTPYWKEPMESMGPFSPIQEENWMKGHQIAATTTAENIIAYWMDECPTDILYVSATEELLEEWSTKRIDPLIDSLGFRYKIVPQTDAKNTHRSADKILSKEYPGGSLKLTSARSAGNLRAMSRRLIVKDEMDGAPIDLKTGEGNYSDVADARASAWGFRKKILNLGTPGVWDQSLIRQKYELGDCRKYMVPCPYCGKEQELVLLGDEAAHGLKGEMKAGNLVKAYYLCEFCHEAFFDYHKTEILARGRWIATKPSSSPFIISRHISSLYSPMGMLSWTELYRKYLESRGDPEKTRSFVTLYLGQPYREEGTRPPLDLILDHIGAYHVGEIQRGTLYLTAGVDVQVGKEKWQPLDPSTHSAKEVQDNLDEGPRLEMEVLCHGQDYRTWSLIYKKFYGHVDDPYSEAWEDFYQWCADPDARIHKGESTAFVYKTERLFTICAIFIDSGDLTDVVYRFCSRAPVFFPSKGLGWVTDAKLLEKGDVAGPMNFRHYRPARVPNSEKELFELSTNYYKGELYSRLKVQREQLPPQRPSFQDFPIEYDKEYFEQLRAEERRRDGSFHKVKTRNEALDCRVYAMAAGEVYLMGELARRRDGYKKAGATEDFLRSLTPKWLLDQWATEIWKERT